MEPLAPYKDPDPDAPLETDAQYWIEELEWIRLLKAKPNPPADIDEWEQEAIGNRDRLQSQTTTEEVSQ